MKKLMITKEPHRRKTATLSVVIEISLLDEFKVKSMKDLRMKHTELIKILMHGYVTNSIQVELQ